MLPPSLRKGLESTYHKRDRPESISQNEDDDGYEEERDKRRNPGNTAEPMDIIDQYVLPMPNPRADSRDRQSIRGINQKNNSKMSKPELNTDEARSKSLKSNKSEKSSKNNILKQKPKAPKNKDNIKLRNRAGLTRADIKKHQKSLSKHTTLKETSLPIRSSHQEELLPAEVTKEQTKEDSNANRLKKHTNKTSTVAHLEHGRKKIRKNDEGQEEDDVYV